MKVIEIKMKIQGVCMCKVEGADLPSYPVYIYYTQCRDTGTAPYSSCPWLTYLTL